MKYDPRCMFKCKVKSGHKISIVWIFYISHASKLNLFLKLLSGDILCFFFLLFFLQFHTSPSSPHFYIWHMVHASSHNSYIYHLCKIVGPYNRCVRQVHVFITSHGPRQYNYHHYYLSSSLFFSFWFSFLFLYVWRQ